MKKKTLFFFFILSLAVIRYSLAQKFNYIDIPLVRENERIDVLLDNIVHLGDPSKSCIVLYSDPIGGMYGLTAKGVRTDPSLLDLDFLKEKAQFGYFNYKKFLVLVVNTYDQYDLF